MAGIGEEVPVVFSCAGEQLIGIVHKPEKPQTTGVIVVTGGPQYRVGSHRQNVLLGRCLAEAGFPVLRFDYRGMGDSAGKFVGFEGVDDDIRAAVDRLFEECGDLQRVVLWALCDGASAAAFYAHRDSRVCGLVLINPWVRTLATVAQARVKHYYGAQLTSRDFWLRLLKLEVRIDDAVSGFLRSLRAAAGSSKPSSETVEDLPERVADGLRRYQGSVLLILSGADLTAQEFDAAVLGSTAMAAWQGESRVTVQRLERANHTYSRRPWRDQVHGWTVSWLQKV